MYLEYVLRTTWTPYFAYWALLGVYLIILGIALAGLGSALNKRPARRPARDD